MIRKAWMTALVAFTRYVHDHSASQLLERAALGLVEPPLLAQGDVRMIALIVGAGLLVILLPVLVSRIYRSYGLAGIAISGVLLATALFPRSLVRLVDVPGEPPSDIAPSSLTILTHSVAFVVAAALLVFGRSRFHLPVSLVAFLMLLTGAMFLSWNGTIAQWSGYFVLVCAALAYGVGMSVGLEVFRSAHLARFLLAVSLAIMIIQLGVAVLQLAGLTLPQFLVVSERTLEQTSGRVSGTIGHPANLSKVTFILTLLALPFTVSTDRRTRRLAFSLLSLCVVVGGLTVSRANLVAMFILLAAWFVTYPGRARIGTRVGGALALGGAAIVFGPLLLERIAEDAEGGLRPQLLEAGLSQIQRDPWLGTGPNSYVEIVGQYDAATASGYPVHNAFLLLVAEVGIVPAALFFVPLISLAVWAIRKFFTPTEYLYVPRAVVYSVPGMAVVLTTGWGMVSAIIVGLWMFSLGVLSAAKSGVGVDHVPASEDVGVGQLRPGLNSPERNRGRQTLPTGSANRRV